MIIRNDEIDISDTSNSWNRSWRQNNSLTATLWTMKSIPDGFTDPSNIARLRGLGPIAKLICTSVIFLPPFSRSGTKLTSGASSQA